MLGSGGPLACAVDVPVDPAAAPFSAIALRTQLARAKVASAVAVNASAACAGLLQGNNFSEETSREDEGKQVGGP